MLRALAISARVTGIAAVFFIWIFALDVFGPDSPWTEQALGFLIHSIPNFVLLGVLAIAWRFERVGGVLFLVVAVAPFLLLSNEHWINAILAAPFVLTGLLFLLAGILRQRRRKDISASPSPARAKTRQRSSRDHPD
jgi:hypothetical protein